MVPGGIDIARETAVVATADGTARHRNLIRRLDDGESDGGPLTITTDGDQFAVGDAAGAADSEGAAVLFGDGWGPDVLGAAVGALLADASATAGPLPPGEDRLGVVERDPATARQLSALREFDAVPVDPGMAVCYDAFGEQPDGIGVAIGDGVAAAAVAVAGTPVAVASVDYEDRWDDVTGAGDRVAGDGIGAEWTRIKYEALLGRLGASLAAEAPALPDSVALAIGGSDAPVAVEHLDVGGLGEPLGVVVDPVPVAEPFEASPARGALLVAERAGDQPGPVPAFAATAAYVPGLADTGKAAEALGDAADRQMAATGTAGGPMDGDSEAATAAGGRGQERSAGTTGEQPPEPAVAAAVGRLVDRMEGTADRLAAYQESVDETLGELADDIEAVREDAAPERALEELTASVQQLEAFLDELEADIEELQAAVTGLEDGTGDAPAVADALGSVAVDTLENDLDAVEEDLSARIEGIWAELDAVDDELVDLSAQVADLPDLADEVESTAASVGELRAETAELRESVAGLRESVASVEESAAMGDDVDALAEELAGLGTELDRLRTEFRELDRADPAAVEQLQADLDALRETVVDHAQRLEGVERTASDLDDRLESAFRDTAKADALSSLQAEVSRIREAASEAQEQAGSAVETTEQQADTIGTLEEDVDQLRQMVDSVAGSTVTRSELEDLEERVAALEQAPGGQPSPAPFGRNALALLAVAIGSAGVLGAMLALTLGDDLVVAGFFLLVVGPAAWLLLTALDL